MDKFKRKYEISFLLKEESSRNDLLEILSRCCEIIEEKPLQRIKLTHPVQKETFVYFGYAFFTCEPKEMEKIAQELKANALVLRFLIITVPKIKTTSPQEKRVKIKSATEETKTSRPGEERRRGQEGMPRNGLSNEALEKKLEEILQE